MTIWTRAVCLKTEVVLQTVLKDHNYVMRRVCFQELHIMVQYVRYEKIVSATKNKRLLGFYRTYVYGKYWIYSLKEATTIHKIFETKSSFCVK